MWLKVSMSLRIILNETHKRLLLLWDYKFDTLMQALIISLIFLGAIFFLGKERIDQQQLPGQFLGYVIWVYARMATKNLSDDIIAEAQAGTLEQMYMSPVRPELLLVGRMIAFTISTTLVICLIACVLVIPLHIDIPLRWGGIPIMLVTLGELFGFTLFLSGLALVFKQISALADMLQNLMLFLTGSLVPVSAFPTWLTLLTKILPTTEAVIVLRSVQLRGQSLVAAWLDGSLGALLLHALLYLGVGWLVYKLCERYARQQGSLGQY